MDLEKYKLYVENARKAYRENFVVGGKLACNNPARREGLTYPNKRHGGIGQVPAVLFLAVTGRLGGCGARRAPDCRSPMSPRRPDIDP